MHKIISLVLLLIAASSFGQTQPLTAGNNWYFYANAISACTPGSLTLPNLAEMVFLQTAIGMAVEPAEQNKINSYFKNSRNVVSIVGKQGDSCVMKLGMHPADGSFSEFQCTFSKQNFPVIVRIANELAKDHTGMSAAPYVIDGVNAAMQSCKQSF